MFSEISLRSRRSRYSATSLLHQTNSRSLLARASWRVLSWLSSGEKLPSRLCGAGAIWLHGSALSYVLPPYSLASRLTGKEISGTTPLSWVRLIGKARCRERVGKEVG